MVIVKINAEQSVGAEQHAKYNKGKQRRHAITLGNAVPKDTGKNDDGRQQQKSGHRIPPFPEKRMLDTVQSSFLFLFGDHSSQTNREGTPYILS